MPSARPTCEPLVATRADCDQDSMPQAATDDPAGSIAVVGQDTEEGLGRLAERTVLVADAY